MTKDQDRPPFEGVSTSEDVLIQNPHARLGELVDNDPCAPILASVPEETSLTLSFKELVEFVGHFPSGVAFFAIAVLACVVIACTSSANGGSPDDQLPVMGLILGSALIAQIIEGKSK